MKPETTKIFIVKYALTEGIFIVDATERAGNMYSSPSTQGFGTLYWHKNEYALTVEEAIARAEELRKKKLKSLRKQLDKLEQKVFTEATIKASYGG